MMPVRSEMNNIAEALNKRDDVSGITIDNAERCGLTPEQAAFWLLYRPQQHLVVYGTLAPGQSNHHIVLHIKGEWRPAVIQGKLEFRDTGPTNSYPAFSHTTPELAATIESFVFSSRDLAAHWPLLDEFEGEGYRRILTRYELKNGDFGYGYIYAFNEE